MGISDSEQPSIAILRSASVKSIPKNYVASVSHTFTQLPKKSIAQEEPTTRKTELQAIVADSAILNQGDASNDDNRGRIDRDRKSKDKAKENNQTINRSNRSGSKSTRQESNNNDNRLQIQASASMKDDGIISDPVPEERSANRKVEYRQRFEEPEKRETLGPQPAPRPEALQPINPPTEKNIKQREESIKSPTALHSVASSNISVHSASPTIVTVSSYPGNMTQLQKRTSTLSTTTTLATFTAAGPSQSQSRLDLGLDVDHFRIVFKELEALTEKLQDLNDQIIEALTLYPISIQYTSNSSLAVMENLTDPLHDGITPAEPSAPTLASSASSTTSDISTESDSYIPHKYTREEKGKDKAVLGPEEEYLIVAQTLTNLVESAWPRIYRIQTEPQTAQMTKERIKIATKLKNFIVVFWSIQTHFQDQAQLILDLYQDPAQFEREDRILILKSRHLNNLLSNPEISAAWADYLLAKFRADQQKLASLSERLQAVWLGILLLLGGPHQTRTLSRAHEMDVGSHHWNSGHQHHQSSSSFMSSLSPLSTEGRRYLRLSGNKRLALKVSMLMLVGAGMIGMALMINTKDPSR
ncbi:hypothetical protein MVEG_10081 [Podila verticillata NRRL 6337]|nr:hypothetical protein MVEG_10081 [Podila verticillata NRRL 6337]